MSWKQGLPRNSGPWGRGEEEHGYLAFFSLVLAKPKLLVPWLSGIFPFKVIGAAETSLTPSLHPCDFSVPICKVGMVVDNGIGCLAWSKSSVYWSSDEDEKQLVLGLWGPLGQRNQGGGHSEELRGVSCL